MIALNTRATKQEPTRTAVLSAPAPRDALLATCALTALLLALGVAAALIGRTGPPEAVADIAGRFLLGSEATVPAWYSSVLLLTGGALLIPVARQRPAERWRFRGLAVIFVGLSIDETAQIHELGQGVMGLLGVTTDAFSVWIIPGALFTAAVALLSVRLLRSVPREICVLWMLAGALFCTGALGMELLGTSVRAVQGSSVSYLAIMTLEEGLEMLGAGLFIYANLRLLHASVAPAGE